MDWGEIMKKFGLAFAAAVMLLGGLVVADDKTPDTKAPAASHGRGSLPQHWGRLGLSDDQKQKVRTIREGYRGKIDELEQQMKELRKKERAEMEAVLTDAQKQRLREIMTEGAPAAPDKGGDKKP
jgi:Spy/CpxP family protein refolding chaperone